jgi:hypothetical protein
MTRHSLSKEARKHNAAEQFAHFGLHWEVRGYLHNAPSIAATLAPNAYEITGRIRRRRKGFTYVVDGNPGHSIRTYELTYLDACEAVLAAVLRRIERAEKALGDDRAPPKANQPDGNLLIRRGHKGMPF